MRIKHWIKNLFVFAPLFFSGNIYSTYTTGLLGFLGFCLLSSCVYIINDIKDEKYDIHNPSKNNTAIPKIHLYIASFILLAIAFGISIYLGSYIPFSIYLLINFLYTFKLKEIPYLEMLFVSSGFIIRVFFGGEIAHVPITNWLYIEVFILTLIIVLSKRIKELNFYHSTHIKVRKVINQYPLAVLIFLFYLFSCAIIIIYSIYCFDRNVINRTNSHIWITIPFVILGITRFIILTKQNNTLLNPINILFKDFILLASVIGWIISWGFLYYDW